MTTYYKIQLKSDPEKYVKGTPTYYHYNSVGRIFTSLGRLRSFITGAMNNRWKSPDFSDWQVVELKMTITDIRELHDIVKPEKIVQLLKQ